MTYTYDVMHQYHSEHHHPIIITIGKISNKIKFIILFFIYNII